MLHILRLLFALSFEIKLGRMGVGGEQSDLIDGPVLKEIDPDAFLAAVLRQPAQDQFEVFQCLLSRHGRGGFGRGLEEERPWVKALHEAMLRLAGASEAIRRDKLTVFAGWVGQNVQDATEGDEARAAPAD